VPLSPVIRTGASDGAMRLVTASSSTISGLLPMKTGSIELASVPATLSVAASATREPFTVTGAESSLLATNVTQL
jgi:hypothetical protein